MKELTLTRGYVALIDDEDFERVSKFKWCANPQSHTVYARRGITENTTEMLHRFILGAIPGQIVDHINHNGLDNRRCNLRFVTPSQNSANAKRRNKYKGIYTTKNGTWRARIKCNGKMHLLGTHKTAELAAKAYDQKAKELFGPYANLNFQEAA